MFLKHSSKSITVQNQKLLCSIGKKQKLRRDTAYAFYRPCKLQKTQPLQKKKIQLRQHPEVLPQMFCPGLSSVIDRALCQGCLRPAQKLVPSREDSQL